jgi:hypothetical protein
VHHSTYRRARDDGRGIVESRHDAPTSEDDQQCAAALNLFVELLNTIWSINTGDIHEWSSITEFNNELEEII